MANSETSKFLKNRVLNWGIAQNWIQKQTNRETSEFLKRQDTGLIFFLIKMIYTL